MKTTFLFAGLTALMVTALSSCNSGDQSLLPPCTGKPGEVLIIMADDLYKGAAGDTLVNLLTQEEPALPQTGMEGAEAMFSVLHLPPNALNNTIRPARNMVIADVGSQYTKSEVKVFKDYWSKDQLLIRLQAPGRDELLQLILDNGREIVEVMRDGEIDRQVAYNRKYRNQDAYDKLLNDHQIDISFPKGFEMKVDTGNFAWLQYDPAEMTQGVFLWSYPYTSEKQLEPTELQRFTNEFLLPRVPGPSGPAKASYMRIYADMPVATRTFNSNGNFVCEMKGLWEVKVDFMGGPFISWTFVDEKRNRIVTVFGFVYAPKIDKRNQVRKVESILKTVDFPDQVR